MGLNGLIRSLERSTRHLQNAYAIIARNEHNYNVNFDPRLEILPPDPYDRAELTAITADANLAFFQVNKYQAILCGIPLDWDEALVDRFTSPINVDGAEAVIAWFMRYVSGGTSLEFYLRAERPELYAWATDEEIFSTYRAIGSMRFSDFEVAVHRAADRVEDLASELVAALQAEEEAKKVD